uniref:UDP-glucose--hexose-1-phosphate uridylyltransferase n=1 Tax=Fulvivirga sp. TaxID=1931237 RepID=UPI004049ABDE
MFSIDNHSHRRYNLLTGDWVQVSPHRAKRPWQGQKETADLSESKTYDKTCYLCPGNQRANGETNPDYQNVFSFENDFAALQPEVPSAVEDSGFFQYKSERGICKVICFSPRHDLTIPEMRVSEIEKVVKLWVQECEELGKKAFINHIQIFENKGSIMGCSNPHPHGQIWAQESIPDEPAKKSSNQADYFLKHKSTLLSDYLKAELKEETRVLYQNDQFIVIVPFWAIWPFEAMIVPNRPMQRITEMNKEEQLAFACAYKWLTIRYDNLFETSFPYSAGIHQAPYDGKDHPHWHWHMTFYPPLLRSATVKKFMVGYEMLANPQRDITPEQAADRLKELSGIHYKMPTNK